jgi:hypothetical protein
LCHLSKCVRKGRLQTLRQTIPEFYDKYFGPSRATIEREVEDIVGVGIVAYINPHPGIGGFADAEREAVLNGKEQNQAYTNA